MLQSTSRRAYTGALLVGLAMLVAAGWPSASRLAAQDDKPAATKPAEKPERNKPRGRLPMFYAKVVNEKQREQIYAIQRKYEKQIADLTAQLQAVEKERDEEIHAVLTPEQQKQIALFMEDLQKRRNAARSDTNPSADGGSKDEGSGDSNP